MIGTPAEIYFRNRGCAMPTGQDVRYGPNTWHWKARQHAPAILCRVTDFVTGEPLTVHLTFITEDGLKSPLIPRKLMLPGHQKQGGVVRLTDDADVTLCLGVAEGMETALTVMATGFGPVWAAIDAGNMASLPVLPGIENLWIFADHDPAGIKAAHSLRDRWAAAGRDVFISKPPQQGADWNDFDATIA